MKRRQRIPKKMNTNNKGRKKNSISLIEKQSNVLKYYILIKILCYIA